jgi:hypothetical protein
LWTQLETNCVEFCECLPVPEKYSILPNALVSKQLIISGPARSTFNCVSVQKDGDRK